MADELTAVSILVVFATVFLGILAPQVRDIRKERLPSKMEPSQLQRQLRYLHTVLWTRAVPLLVGVASISYVLLPTATRIMARSKLQLWNFDTLSTLYVVIYVGVLALLVLSLQQIIFLVRRRKKLQATSKS